MAAPTPEPLTPERALLHPAWLLGLAVLILNDHVLKGAELLPAALTGKLSDVAGLLIAPLLLAAVVRARSRLSVGAAHVAVGAVFAALQLSPAFAGAWSGLFDALGVGWVTWQDPTDLLALPALGLSWWLFVPVAARPVPTRQLARFAQVGVASVGVIFCMATSPPPCEDGDTNCYSDDCGYDEMRNDVGECQPFFEAGVYVHNDTSEAIEVVVRPLAASLDCAVVSTDPTAFLTEPAFAPGTTWTVPAHTSLPVTPADTTSCPVALIEGDDLPQALLVWTNQEYPIRRHFAEPVVDLNALPPGGILVRRNPQHNLALEQHGDGSNILYKLNKPAPLSDPACVPTPLDARIDWSPVALTGLNVAISEVTLGADGCFGLTLDPGDHPSLPPKGRWYVCVDPDLFPFEDGDIVQITDSQAPGTALLTVRRTGTVDPEHPRPYVAMLAMRSSQTNGLSAESITLNPQAIEGCGTWVDPSCGASGQNLSLEVRDAFSDDVLTLTPGESGAITRFDGATRDVRLIAATRLAINPTACLAPTGVGVLFDLVVLDRLETNP